MCLAIKFCKFRTGVTSFYANLLTAKAWYDRIHRTS
nr:MAG TPA: hypothetical protein [Caudoviricetes sp.]